MDEAGLLPACVFLNAHIYFLKSPLVAWLPRGDGKTLLAVTSCLACIEESGIDHPILLSARKQMSPKYRTIPLTDARHARAHTPVHTHIHSWFVQNIVHAGLWEKKSRKFNEGPLAS